MTYKHIVHPYLTCELVTLRDGPTAKPKNFPDEVDPVQLVWDHMDDSRSNIDKPTLS